MKKYLYLLITYISVPSIGFAQEGSARDARSLLNFLRGLFNNSLIPIFVTLGLVYFIWAVVGFISSTDDSAKREEKKQQIFWALIGLFVILSVISLINLVGNTFDIFRGGNLERA